MLYENLTIENISDNKQELILKIVNEDPTGFSELLLAHLKIIDVAMNFLDKTSSILPYGAFTDILGDLLISKVLLELIKHKKELFKVTASELELFKNNAITIVNSINIISEKQVERLKKITVEDLLLVYNVENAYTSCLEGLEN